MAFTPGKNAWIMMDGVNGAGTIVSHYADNFSIPQPTDVHDVSVFGTVAKTNVTGLMGGGVIGLSGPLDTTWFLMLDSIQKAQAAGSTTSTVVYAAQGSVSGNLKQTVEVWVADLQDSTGVGGRAEYSASLQITGAITATSW